MRHSVLQADSTYVVLTHGEAHADIQVLSHSPVRFEQLPHITLWSPSI